MSDPNEPLNCPPGGISSLGDPIPDDIKDPCAPDKHESTGQSAALLINGVAFVICKHCGAQFARPGKWKVRGE